MNEPTPGELLARLINSVESKAPEDQIQEQKRELQAAEEKFFRQPSVRTTFDMEVR